MRLKQTQPPDLVPAAVYLLMTGSFVQASVHGWAGLHWQMTPFAHNPQAWRDSVMTPEIGAWLAEAAAAYHFEPWALSGSCPRGDGVSAWETAFIREHASRG